MVVPDPVWSGDGLGLHVVAVPPDPGGEIHVPGDRALLPHRGGQHQVTQEELVINTQSHLVMGVKPPDGPGGIVTVNCVL